MPAYISSIGTAVPPTRVSQKDLVNFMLTYLPLSDEEKTTLKVIYRASGIHYRHTVIADYAHQSEEFTFFPKTKNLEPFPSVGQRMELYKKEAIKLCVEAVDKCLNRRPQKELTHLITVSCTGMYAPGIDIELIERLNLATDIQRTSINFMGCYAAFNALKVANEIIHNNAKANILIVAVELCSLHLLKKSDEDSLLSNALFGDGAAAILLEGSKLETPQLQLESFYSDLALDSKDEMSWHIGDFGFEMKLSSEVPASIKKGIGQLTGKLLEKLNISVADIDHFAIHPGGKKILEVIEQELGIDQEQNSASYSIMKNYGNMSSPTVVFVLHELMNSFTNANADERILSFAFGPGLTLESMLLKVT